MTAHVRISQAVKLAEMVFAMILDVFVETILVLLFVVMVVAAVIAATAPWPPAIAWFLGGALFGGIVWRHHDHT